MKTTREPLKTNPDDLEERLGDLEDVIHEASHCPEACLDLSVHKEHDLVSDAMTAHEFADALEAAEQRANEAEATIAEYRKEDPGICPKCGPIQSCDEDGCCNMCGTSITHDEDGNVLDTAPNAFQRLRAQEAEQCAEKAEGEIGELRDEVEQRDSLACRWKNKHTAAEAEAKQLTGVIETAIIGWTTRMDNLMAVATHAAAPPEIAGLHDQGARQIELCINSLRALLDSAKGGEG